MNSIIIYSILSFLLFFFSSKFSYHLGLVDMPNKRKVHLVPTAYTGGITISIILLSALQIFNFFDLKLNMILSMGFLISIVGLIDDKYHLNVGGKLSLQIIPIFYLVIFENLSLVDIGNYDYFYLKLETFKIPFTLICVLFLINAFNYFDGIDGTLSISSISVIMILYYLLPEENLKIFLHSLFIPLVIFLLFNFSIYKLPKMFLGDGGSLLLGFIFSFFLIYLAIQKIVHPILLAWSIAIFVYEFMSINIIRLINKQNPFKASQDHLHHLICKKTKSIFITNFFMFTLNILLFIVGYISFILVNSFVSLTMYLFLFFIFFIFRNRYSMKKSIEL